MKERTKKRKRNQKGKVEEQTKKKSGEEYKLKERINEIKINK